MKNIRLLNMGNLQVNNTVNVQQLPDKVKVDILIYDTVAPSKIFDAIDVMSQLSGNDEVIIHLNTPGGAVPILSSFILGMQECEATITTHVHRMAASCGSVILAYGNIIKADLHSTVMIHDMGAAVCGKLHAIKNLQNQYRGWSDEIMNRFKQLQLITDEEVKSIVDEGRDFYLSGENLHDRLHRCNAILRAGGV